MKFEGRTIYQGKVTGEVIATKMAVSFFGGVDPETGIVLEKGHELDGLSISGKVLVFPTGKGSTVGSYTLYRLAKAGMAPKAIINHECETITAVGAIISEIPCIDKIQIEKFRTGMQVEVDADSGTVKTLEGTP